MASTRNTPAPEQQSYLQANKQDMAIVHRIEVVLMLWMDYFANGYTRFCLNQSSIVTLAAAQMILGLIKGKVTYIH